MQVHLAQRTAFLKKTFGTMPVIMRSTWGVSALLLGIMLADRLGWKSDEFPWLVLVVASALAICACVALFDGIRRHFVRDPMTSDTH